MNLKEKISKINSMETRCSDKKRFYNLKDKVFSNIFKKVCGNEEKFNVTYSVCIEHDAAIYESNMEYDEYVMRYTSENDKSRDKYYYDLFRLEIDNEPLIIPSPVFLRLLEKLNIKRTNFFKNAVFYIKENNITFKTLYQGLSYDPILWSEISDNKKYAHLIKCLDEFLSQGIFLTDEQRKAILQTLDINTKYEFKLAGKEEFAEIIKLKHNSFSHSWAGSYGTSESGTFIFGCDEFSFGCKSSSEYSDNGNTSEPDEEEYEGEFDTSIAHAVIIDTRDWNHYNNPIDEHDYTTYEVVIYIPAA